MKVRDLLIRAAIIAAVFAALHIAGIRDWTSVLCGTSPLSSSRSVPAALGGAAYIVFYLGATVVAPILLIAAAILALWRRSRVGTAPSPRTAAEPEDTRQLTPDTRHPTLVTHFAWGPPPAGLALSGHPLPSLPKAWVR